MAPVHVPSILSTHSGHHRIFIGPVIQQTNPQNATNGLTSNISSSSFTRHNNNAKNSKRGNINSSNSHSNQKSSNHHYHESKSSSQAPKPWWDQGSSFLKSHLSLHHQLDQQQQRNNNNHPTTTTSAAAKVGVKAASVGSKHIYDKAARRPNPAQHQASYTFSDDTDSCSSSDNEDGTEDEQDGMYDSEDERKDYENDRLTSSSEGDGEDDHDNIHDHEYDDPHEDVMDIKDPRDIQHKDNDNRSPTFAKNEGQTFKKANSWSSAESVSARVGPSQGPSITKEQTSTKQNGALGDAISIANTTAAAAATVLLPGINQDDIKTRSKGKNKKQQQPYATDNDHDNGDQHGDDDGYHDIATDRAAALSETSTATRWGSSKRRKRTKSMRDEGEPNRLKKLFGIGPKEKQHHQGRIDDPDLGYESDGSRVSRPHLPRQATSGALTLGHYHGHGHVSHHPVLVGSPMSSEIDLPGSGGGAVFVSSPVSSILDGKEGNNHSMTMESSDRPDPSPIQKLPNATSTNDAMSGHLSPQWRPSSIHSFSSAASSPSSPSNCQPKRGATWMTARESPSSLGGRDDGLLLDQKNVIKEEDEEEDEEDETEHGVGADTDGDHFELARMISHESNYVDAPSLMQQDQAITTITTSTSAAGRKSSEVNETSDPSSEKAAKCLNVSVSLPQQASSSSTPTAATTEKEPFSTTLDKASTRFGRALLNRNLTGLKRHGDMPLQPIGSICSIDKDCQGSLRHRSSDAEIGIHQGPPKVGKHVRFLTKVQYHIAGGSTRQSTRLWTDAIVKQDRMLARREVTQRPGPHVFNSDTARRLERQSQGWKEWWCVMKGPSLSSVVIADNKREKVSKIKRKRSKKRMERVEKGRLEFYYNHKKIKDTVILSSCTAVSVYSSLDYSIAVTQNYPEAIGLTVYILRPRTISLACAWYMEIYTLLNGTAPIPKFIELAVPDFDVKIRVPIPEDSETETDDDDNDDEGTDNEESETSLSYTLPIQGPRREPLPLPSSISSRPGITEGPNTADRNADDETGEAPLNSFKTVMSSFPDRNTNSNNNINDINPRMATRTFYLTNDRAKPQLVAPNQVTPKLLRSHALSLLKDVPDWAEVVRMWQDPTQHGDVALCWKRYDRIEWIYWGGQNEHRVLPETDDLHLRKDHIGFADGSDWSGGMDETVVGPQILDKTHVLELRPITHYPSRARIPACEGGTFGGELHEPDPIEGYLVRVSAFSGNPLRRFRRLYLTSHDHMLFYTIPSESHSPTMSHALAGGAGEAAIDPAALLFCITPHRSVNPDHKDMAQSRSVRRLKAQVRAAKGFIDLTKVDNVRVLTIREWEAVRHLPYQKDKENKQMEKEKQGKIERLGKAVKHAVEEVKEARDRTLEARSSQDQQQRDQQQPQVILREPDNYFFPTTVTEPVDNSEPGPSSSRQSQQKNEGDNVTNGKHLDSSEPMSNSLDQKTSTAASSIAAKSKASSQSFKENLHKSATFVADKLLLNHGGDSDDLYLDEDSNVFEIEMQNGPCVRFRAFNAEAAHLWCQQVQKLAEYWRLRRHLDIKDHMHVAQANCQLASSMDDDEKQLGGASVVEAGGDMIKDWDNDRAMASPHIWNWCVVNGCRSVTKSGMVYFKPKLHRTFRKMFLVLTEGFLMLFHPHRRSTTSGRLIPTTANKLYAIHSLTDIYVYSGHFSDGDTAHGTNDESERLPRFFPDGLIADDPDEDCTFSIWRGKRKKMFSRRGAVAASKTTMMSPKSVNGSSSKVFSKIGWLSNLVKDGVVYGSNPQSCSVFRARSRPDLEEWVYAINTEIERCVRAERRRVRHRLR